MGRKAWDYWAALPALLIALYPVATRQSGLVCPADQNTLKPQRRYREPIPIINAIQVHGQDVLLRIVIIHLRGQDNFLDYAQSFS